jgi:hypothetical protein
MRTYFDSNHPHFCWFTISNNGRTITHNSNVRWHHITSPNKIDETFNTFTYKVIKTKSNDIMYGIGSNQLKNDKTDQYNNAEFIGYYGNSNGYVYD